MTPTEFLEARLEEDEEDIRTARYDDEEWYIPDAARRVRMLADVAAKRQILELHQKWVVLISTPPKLEPSGIDRFSNLESYTVRMTQQIDFATREEYRRRFGDEPPTAPTIMALIQPYHEHPDFDSAWRLA